MKCRREYCYYETFVDRITDSFVAFEVRTHNAFVGLKEPIIGRSLDSWTYSTEAEAIARALPEDPIEFIVAAVKLVRENMSYKELNTRIGVHQAMRLGIGDCEEYTDMLMSLMAARGFVVRRIVGITPGGLHARMEYRSKDGRVPIDPTWNQIGFLDWRHVPIFKGNRWPMRVPKGTIIKTLDVKLIV